MWICLNDIEYKNIFDLVGGNKNEKFKCPLIYQSSKYSLTIRGIKINNILAHSLMVPKLNRYLITSLKKTVIKPS
jgi:ABC-type enterochelin transport system ATPase subunit